MANSKNLFAGLVKYVGSNYLTYIDAKTEGKIIFAEITGNGENSGKYIYANGVEYKVADATNLDALIQRVADVSQGLIDVNALINDLSTRIDTAINGLDISVNALETWKVGVDASLKNHESRISSLESNGSSDLKNASISSISENNAATVTLTTIDASNNQLSTDITLSGDNYVKVGGSANNITLTTVIGDIADATEDASGLATSKAVKDYVESLISSLEQALVFRGELTSANVDASLTTEAREAGDTFVASGTEFTYNSKTIEAGDMVIVSSDSAAGTVSTIIVVQRNLIGAVTSSDTLTADYIVLGNGDQSVKNSSIAIADLITAIGNANSAVQSVTADSSTTDFIDAHVTNNASIYNVQVGVKTATLADASNNVNGLATALDVYTELIKVEETIAAAETAMAATLGMEDNFDVSWGNSGIADGTTYKLAIINAYGAATTPNVTSFGGATGAISVQGSNTNGEINLHMDSSTLKAEVIGLNTVIAEAIDSSIKALDIADASVSGQVVIAVPETDGKVAPERIQLKINGQNFATSDGSMGAVIDGSQILVGGENATHNDSSIAKAIADLSTAIDNISVDAIKSVVGETTISGDGTYVAVTATENPAGTVTLASELTLASNTYGSTDATGLATDAFVKDYLAWEVISD